MLPRIFSKPSPTDRTDAVVDDVSILTVSPLVQELNTVHPNYDIGKRCRNQSLGSSINAKKRQEIARKCWNLTRPVQRIGYQRNLQANQRASARLRGNINDPSQGAHSFAHATNPRPRVWRRSLSNPLPLSCTVADTRSLSWLTVTVTRLASACFEQFVSAS
jgi:hypothetical protein